MLRPLLTALLFCQPCLAHLPSSSTLTLDPEAGGGTWTVGLAVLDDAWLIDADADGKISAAEWRTLEFTARRELGRGLFVAGKIRPVTLRVTEVIADHAGSAPRVTVNFLIETPGEIAPQNLTSRLLAADDPLHRVILRVKGTADKVLHASSPTAAIR